MTLPHLLTFAGAYGYLAMTVFSVNINWIWEMMK